MCSLNGVPLFHKHYSANQKNTFGYTLSLRGFVLTSAHLAFASSPRNCRCSFCILKIIALLKPLEFRSIRAAALSKGAFYECSFCHCALFRCFVIWGFLSLSLSLLKFYENSESHTIPNCSFSDQADCFVGCSADFAIRLPNRELTVCRSSSHGTMRNW